MKKFYFSDAVVILLPAIITAIVVGYFAYFVVVIADAYLKALGL